MQQIRGPSLAGSVGNPSSSSSRSPVTRAPVQQPGPTTRVPGRGELWQEKCTLPLG